ncbi:putative glycoside hydrolase [Alicyclobacillus mengziensis]|uniref:DUF4015 domain-containing protein n=1 Tax=Alicyclobacillus mengziensis TaxID=2931921 RepID=A0A9X7Z6H3_9BACL|nr:putative glycoside hydrolase [Alicyclobacillus mengziensis]QSO47387.1 hypothetical protein JZ786_23875 [Alicyclobacillus mengziensis]
MKKRSIPTFLVACVLLTGCATKPSSSASVHSTVSQKPVTTKPVTTKPVDTKPVDTKPNPTPKIPDYSLGVPEPKDIHGIYVSAYAVSDPAVFQNLLHLVDTTSLNTMVIDMKIDNGDITFATNNPELKPYSKSLIKNPQKLMATLKAHHIYPIARIAVFEDTLYADAHPEDSFLLNGKPWIGRQGQAYTNPFLPNVWKYNVDVAKAVAKLGFEQIQFDFVRFPSALASMQGTIQYQMGSFQNQTPTEIQATNETYQQNLKVYQNKLASLQAKETAIQSNNSTDSGSELQTIQTAIADLQKKKPIAPHFTTAEKLGDLRVNAVTDFVKYAYAQLKPYHVKTAVDIFGYTATIPESTSVGQSYPSIAQNVDVMSPMIYPSLWGSGYFGLAHPDLNPYQTVVGFMQAEQKIMSGVKHKPELIPWIQDYTATFLGAGNYQTYTKTQVDEQIQALAKYGVNSYLIWNPSNVYSPGI